MEDLESIREKILHDRFMRYNHLELTDLERDRAVVRLEIRPESKNPYGMIHGGALYTLADEASGAAAHTDGRCYVTQSGTLHFLRGQSSGTVRAEGRVRHRGRSTCLVEVDITGEDGRLLATGESIFFCVDADRMAERRASDPASSGAAGQHADN